MVAKSGMLRLPKEEKPKRGTLGALNAKVPAVNLDRLIHERTRLAIVSALAVNTSLTFKELKDFLRITRDGNLSVHARKLEDAGYIGCNKSFSGRMPKRSTSHACGPQGAREVPGAPGSSYSRHPGGVERIIGSRPWATAPPSLFRIRKFTWPFCWTATAAGQRLGGFPVRKATVLV